MLILGSVVLEVAQRRLMVGHDTAGASCCAEPPLAPSVLSESAAVTVEPAPTGRQLLLTVPGVGVEPTRSLSSRGV